MKISQEADVIYDEEGTIKYYIYIEILEYLLIFFFKLYFFILKLI